jgi:hypothetical protein
MKESIDPAVSGLINTDINLKLKKIANSLRNNWPASLDDIERARKRLKGSHIQLWGDLRSQGEGVPDFSKSRTGNVWMSEYNLLRPSRFIDALRLRTNTFGTRAVLARADKFCGKFFVPRGWRNCDSLKVVKCLVILLVA